MDGWPTTTADFDRVLAEVVGVRYLSARELCLSSGGTRRSSAGEVVFGR